MTKEGGFDDNLHKTLFGPYAILAAREFCPFLKGSLTMAYTITSDCIACGACEPECAEGAISQQGDIYVIDAALCKDCGSCAEVCPVGAPIPA